MMRRRRPSALPRPRAVGAATRWLFAFDSMCEPPLSQGRARAEAQAGLTAAGHQRTGTGRATRPAPARVQAAATRPQEGASVSLVTLVRRANALPVQGHALGEERACLWARCPPSEAQGQAPAGRLSQCPRPTAWAMCMLAGMRRSGPPVFANGASWASIALCARARALTTRSPVVSSSRPFESRRAIP